MTLVADRPLPAAPSSRTAPPSSIDEGAPTPTSSRTGFLDRLRAWGRPPRILGLDLARGIAVIGMIAAHTAITAEFVSPTSPSTWSAIVHGRSALLFALLAGISVSLMTGRTRLPDVDRVPSLRLKLIGRGVAIFLIGVALELLGTGVAVVLTLYGALYLIALPFLRATKRTLLAWAAGVALVAPALTAAIQVIGRYPYGPGWSVLNQAAYPLGAWVALLLAGMAMGRCDLARRAVAVKILVSGAVLSAIGYGVGALGARFAAPMLAASEQGFPNGGPEIPPIAWGSLPGRLLAALVDTTPHVGSTAEILGSGGFAALVIGACLLIAGPLRAVILPVAALGAMPLTVYSLHVVAYWAIAGYGGRIESNAVFWGMTIAALVGSTLWSVLRGRGPLERAPLALGNAMMRTPQPRV